MLRTAFFVDIHKSSLRDPFFFSDKEKNNFDFPPRDFIQGKKLKKCLQGEDNYKVGQPRSTSVRS